MVFFTFISIPSKHGLGFDMSTNFQFSIFKFLSINKLIFALVVDGVIFVPTLDTYQHDIWCTTSLEEDNGDIFKLHTFCPCLQHLFEDN